MWAGKNFFCKDRAGVHLAVGAIQIVKEVTGPASAYAPDEFRANVSCSIEGVNLAMGQNAVVELTSNNGFTERIDGIPLGAECAIAEQGALGSLGETTRMVSPGTIAVDEVVASGAGVPSAQVSQITNDYQFSGLSVTKRVQTDATAGQFGPFDFTLTCESATGIPVIFSGAASELTFSLSDGETFTAPSNAIPARANCLVSELTSSPIASMPAS